MIAKKENENDNCRHTVRQRRGGDQRGVRERLKIRRKASEGIKAGDVDSQGTVRR